MLEIASKLKAKVKACQKICGTHTAFAHSQIMEIYGYCGYDFIWLDYEHCAGGYTMETIDMLNAAHLGGTPVIVRTSQTDRNHLKRILEMGPDGIIFPMVSTAEEAEEAMKSCMYPPEGVRGFGPQHAVRYGFDDVNEYIRKINDCLCRFIQVETKKAVKNLREIVKNPYIDGYIFGPCDLSGSIGKLNQVFDDENVALIKEAIAILKDNGKCIGVSTGSSDPEVLGFWDSLGINMISCGVDYAYVRDGAMANLAAVKKAQGRG